jgi:hypothetical protein
MSTILLDMPYEIVRLFTKRLRLEDTLRLSETCLRLSSFLDYNHDPRLDDQWAIERAVMKNRGPIIRKLLLVEHVDTSRGLAQNVKKNWS